MAEHIQYTMWNFNKMLKKGILAIASNYYFEYNLNNKWTRLASFNGIKENKGTL